MIISLLGYMGSGKSHISKLLNEKTGQKIFDTDKEISKKNKQSISEIFAHHGEIYFRKKEREVLEEIFAQESEAIISLGGGTPCYYNNMEIINQHSISIYLRASINTLTHRLLKQKEKRPLIAKISDENLPEFIAKHLFERNVFYSKAQFVIDTDEKTPEEIVQEIIEKVY